MKSFLITLLAVVLTAPSLAQSALDLKPAQVALDAVKEQPPSMPGAPSHSRARFKATVMAADRPADILTTAMLSPDPGPARLAFTLIANGVATREACAWLGEHAQELSESRQVMAMNLLLQVNAKEKETVIRNRAREATGSAKRAAIQHLGIVGTPDDLLELEGHLLGSEPGLAEAAKQAFIALPRSVVGRYLLDKLQGAGPSPQLIFIEIAAARGDDSVTETLFAMANQDGHPNQKAAIRALGRVGDIHSYPAVLDAFTAASRRGPATDWQSAMWDMTRRHPDYDQAMTLIEKQKAKRPENEATLTAMAKKLTGLQPKPSFNAEAHVKSGYVTDLLLPGSFRDITPQRFEVVAYLDCGPQTRARGGGITIDTINGTPFRSEAGEDPSLSVTYAGTSLDYRIQGLDATTEYLIGFTWWDSTLDGRWQSIHINGEEVLPATRPIAYEQLGGKKTDPAYPYRGLPTPARIQFPLRPGQIKDGACAVSIKRLGPANAVNSELWIMRRRQPRAEKQVLLVSGQDYPGHHWRETGPVVEKLIIENDRMEVTLCETPYVLGLKHLDVYDAVFLHCKNYESELPSTEVMRTRFERYVRNGGGLCLSHFACGAFQEWPEFVQLSGRVWSGGGHDRRGPFPVTVVDRDHPVTRGVDDFETDDELYWCLQGDPQIHLLCEAFSVVKKVNHPQAFVYQAGEGRVFLSTLGHDVRAFEPREVQQLYRQGTAWAAKLDEASRRKKP